MNTKAVLQAVTRQSLFGVLEEWFKAGAGETRHSIKILSAFVTGGGVKAIAPLLGAERCRVDLFRTQTWFLIP